MRRISIVIPLYNEILNIFSLISEIELFIANKFIYELILVDDCSKDGTFIELKNKLSTNNIIILKNDINRGQSYSICKGIKNAKYENIVTIDGDGQNPPKDILTVSDIFFNNSLNYRLNLLPMQKGDVYKTYADNKKLMKLIKKYHFINIEKGIELFLKWFQNYHNI